MPPKPAEVIDAACEVCGVPLSDLFGPTKTAAITEARRVATVCLYDLILNASFPMVNVWMRGRRESWATSVGRYHAERSEQTQGYIDAVKGKFEGEAQCS